MHSGADPVLDSFLAAGPDGFVSGEELARRLGVSRVSVWARLKKLRAAGWKFAAARGRGYRLAAEPAALHPAALAAHLRARHPEAVAPVAGLDVVYLPEVDSTNEEAQRRLAAGARTPFVVFAGRQTAGRGRLGRAWHSRAPGNLYLSFGFQPRLPPARMTQFTLWMGLRLGRLLNTAWALPVRVKWPNDLVHDGRKLAGMLTEARIDADVMRDLVFGLGLNVNGVPARWGDRALARTAGTLQQVNRGRALPLNAVAADVAAAGARAYHDFINTDFKAEFTALWERYDALRGRPVTVTLAQGKLRGRAAGLDDSGALVLALPGGARRAVQSGDVSLGGYGRGSALK